MTTVIIGAGQAASELATALRQQGYGEKIIMLGDEPYPPYRRPPLSKTFLAGEGSIESLYLKSPEGYAKANVDCEFGVTVTAVDRVARSVTLADGRAIHYDKLAFATGGRVRKLTMPGADKPNVFYIRNIADILNLRRRCQAGQRLTIIGGGFIGLEVAAVGIKMGLKVTVLESLPRVLARVTAPEMSAFYERSHREHGVDLRTGVSMALLEGAAEVSAIVLSDGSRIATDIVVVGIGLIPNIELAAAAGLEVTSGIVVDEHARTSDPDIVATGDCADLDHGFLKRRLRLESVQNAVEQSRVAAASICGKPVVYNAVPWFWSDQYDLKLQMAGVSQGYDQIVIRGHMSKKSFSALYLQSGVLIAVDAVNRAADFMAGKRLVGERAKPDPRVLADEAVPLKTLVASAAAS
jgi:3-phenylpropionate/trans-cinnamate dioxygenase ferredoxin reductase component